METAWSAQQISCPDERPRTLRDEPATSFSGVLMMGTVTLVGSLSSHLQHLSLRPELLDPYTLESLG
jgi:hypothetical protein